MPLTAGQILSCYEILGPLGAGGMGEVYRARDTRLGREVAVKIVPPELAGDEERLQRFRREARVLASLNHPNVAHVYGIDEAAGTWFMAMELVPGQDLGRRLQRGKLPIDEAVDVGRQVALGLEAAHEAGVVHRDLKPSNIHATPNGHVKVLDFGIAKTARPASAEAAEAESLLTTEEGRLLGTPPYMAPEQVRGRPLDRRVDVWAFGCVMFECLSGRRPFEGETLGEVLAAILEREPEWSRLPARTPAHVRHLIERCLDKNPLTRLRDVGEARIVLERGPAALTGIRSGSESRRGLLVWAAVAPAALAVGAVLGRNSIDTSSSRPLPAISQKRLTDMAGMEEMPAVSPDGAKVAFVSRVNGRRQIFVRLLAKGSPEPITHTDLDHSFPRWADDSTLAYLVHSDEGSAAGSLWETDYLGSSSPRLILESAHGEADFDHTGRRIATFRMDDEGPALVVIERGGEKTETVTRLPEATYFSPRWSPDDGHIAFEARVNLITAEIRVMELASGETRTVLRTNQTRGLAWLHDGSGLVYASSAGSTLPYPPIFALRTVKIDGSDDAPLPLADAGYSSYVEPDVTRNGSLVVSRVALESDIYRYPIDGTPLENVTNAERITYQTGATQVPSVSPDGEEVAYLSDSGGRGNVWIARVDGTRRPRQITDELDPDTLIGIPLWSPRGDWIVYFKGRVGANAEEWLVRPDGTGHRSLVEARGAAHWSHDGEWIYYMAPTEDVANPTTYKIPVGGGEPVLVRHGAAGVQVTSDGSTAYFSPSDHREGEVWRAKPVDSATPERLASVLPSRIPLWPNEFALSPDDRWLAMPLRDHGTTNLWLISTADGSQRPVTDFGRRATTIGRQVSWSADSRHIFAALMETDADIVLVDGALQ